MSSDSAHAVTDEGEAAQVLVPKLRFPEFRDAGGWVPTPLRDVCEPINEKVGSAKLTPVSITAGRGFVSQASKFGRDISGVQYRNYTYLRQGDFAYNKGNSLSYPQGWVCQLKEFEEAAASSAFICFRLREDYHPTYFQALFDQNVHGRQLRRFITSGARSNGLLNIRTDDFYGVKIPLPPKIAEQHKISDCLSTLDDLIAAERDRLVALRAYKQGLLQQLFPRPERIENGEKIPAETTPRLRFPEFRHAGEWEERTLAQISPAIFDGTHQTPTYVDEGVPFYSVENLVSGAANRFISQADHDLATAKNKPEIGDLLITRIGKIGYSKIIDWEGDFSIYVTLAVVKQSSGFNSGYMHAFFQSERYQAELAQRSLLNAVPCKINMDELRRSVVLLPSMAEQERIASCFSDCDRGIEAQFDRVKALKTHKFGLMQQLFALPCEVAA